MVMKKLIRLRFLYKSLFGKPFTLFDINLAEALAADGTEPDFVRAVANINTSCPTCGDDCPEYERDFIKVLLPEIFDCFLSDLKEELFHAKG